MPNHYDSYPEPLNEPMHEIFREMWEAIEYDLRLTYFETFNEALNQENRPHLDIDEERFANWRLVPFRKTNDYELLHYYHASGLEALERTKHFIDRGDLGENFAFYWGKLSAAMATFWETHWRRVTT